MARDPAPFLTSVARREVQRQLTAQRRILYVQALLLAVQAVIICLLAFD